MGMGDGKSYSKNGKHHQRRKWLFFNQHRHHQPTFQKTIIIQIAKTVFPRYHTSIVIHAQWRNSTGVAKNMAWGEGIIHFCLKSPKYRSLLVGCKCPVAPPPPLWQRYCGLTCKSEGSNLNDYVRGLVEFASSNLKLKKGYIRSHFT